MQINVLGAGLAGSEAALWLADRGVAVDLYEQKPARFSPAHKSAGFAELICSNSLKAERPDSASGLLKLEMRAMGSHLLDAAETARVAAAVPWRWTGTSSRRPSPKWWKTTPASRCTGRKSPPCPRTVPSSWPPAL